MNIRHQLFADPVSSLYVGTLLIVLGWLTLFGAISNTSGIDHKLHDTFYVIAHWHYTVSIGVALAVFWLAFRWFRSVIGVDYRRWLAVPQWLTMTLGISLMFGPGVWANLASGPHYYTDYPAQVVWLFRVSSAGYLLSLLSSVLFVICVGEGLWRRLRGAKSPPPERTAS